MLDTVIYQGKLVEFKRPINGINSSTSFKKGEVLQINNIILNTKNTKGIKIYFSNEKVLVNSKVINYKSWIAKTLKTRS